MLLIKNNFFNLGNKEINLIPFQTTRKLKINNLKDFVIKFYIHMLILFLIDQLFIQRVFRLS